MRVGRVGDPRSGVWPTPDWLYLPLHALLGFTLDVAALPSNAKCARFYSPRQNGLLRPWDAPSWWGNPPYGGREGTGAWVWKAREEVLRWGNRGVLLLPVKSETQWYGRGVWGRNRVLRSAWIEAGKVRGRWYQLDEPDYLVELLELESRVSYGKGHGATGNTGFFANAVVLFNAPRRPLLPRLASLPNVILRNADQSVTISQCQSLNSTRLRARSGRCRTG